MTVLFFLTSGLFLGWSLGANDAANIFGTAVGTRMVRFKTAAIVASIFVILGAVIQGAGANHTLGKLGSVSTLAAAFTVALSAAFTVYWMTRMSLPVSTSQAIVGAIIGWNIYTNHATDLSVLTQIVVTWISGPVLGGIFAVLIFMLVKLIMRKSGAHLLFKDSFIRSGLIIVGAFGAYSLGANNIANVMGVFTGAVSLPVIDMGFVTIDSTQQLFFIGGIAIAVGIITYSRHVMDTVGNTLMPLTPDSAIVVVLSQALVLFVFSSQSLSNTIQSIGLPPIPLVPVSSSQVVIGSIIGIGIYKGGKEIKFSILGGIGVGWIATPILAGLLAFFSLFFINNVFKQDVGGDRQLGIINTIEQSHENEIILTDTTYDYKGEEITETETTYENESVLNNTVVLIVAFVIVIILIIIFFLLIRRIRACRKREVELDHEIKKLHKNYKGDINALEKELNKLINVETSLGNELKYKQNEMVTMAMNIIHKNSFLDDLKKEVIKIKKGVSDQKTLMKLNNLSLMITQDLSIDRDREKFQMHINEQNSNFIHRLEESFPVLTANEKRLCSMLRLNLSSKEIASVLNISPKSVEMNRYRLRKKLKVDPKLGLADFIRDF